MGMRNRCPYRALDITRLVTGLRFRPETGLQNRVACTTLHACYLIVTWLLPLPGKFIRRRRPGSGNTGSFTLVFAVINPSFGSDRIQGHIP
jgi:hypothetical protein